MASPVNIQTGATSLLTCGIVLLSIMANLGEADDFNTRFITPKEYNKPYCSYFANRSPQPAPELRNCTWYKKVRILIYTVSRLIKLIRNEKRQRLKLLIRVPWLLRAPIS